MPLIRALELFGGGEALVAAAELPLPPRAGRALAELTRIAKVLDELRLADRFRFDLAELRGFDYYTGLIFEVHAPGAGREIGGGGRYDDLLANFGDPRPAVGFSLSVDGIAAILADRPGLDRDPPELIEGGPDSDADSDAGLAARFRAARASRARGGRIRFESGN